MFQVIELNSLQAIEPYESVWRDLYERSTIRQFTRTPEWYQWNIKQSNGSLKPHVLIVYVMNRAIGVVPMVIQNRQTTLGKLRALSYLDASPFSSAGQVGPNAAATLAGAMKHLRNDHRGWDFLDLQGIDYDTEDHHRTPNAMKNAGMKPHEKQWETSTVVHKNETPISLRDRPSLELLGFTFHRCDLVPVEMQNLLAEREENLEWLPFAERSGGLSVFVLRERGSLAAAVIGIKSGKTQTFPLWITKSPINSLVRDAFRRRVLEESFNEGISRCVISAVEFSKGMSNTQRCSTRRYTVFSGKSFRGWVLSAHQTGKRWLRGTTQVAKASKQNVAIENSARDETLSEVAVRLQNTDVFVGDATQPMPRLQIYRAQSADSA